MNKDAIRDKVAVVGMGCCKFGENWDKDPQDMIVEAAYEAYADAVDPTIGFDTSSGALGTMAPSVFAFQNQLDSLLDEELVLLRGRDDSFSSTRARPVYNRLVWNFNNHRN